MGPNIGALVEELCRQGYYGRLRIFDSHPYTLRSLHILNVHFTRKRAQSLTSKIYGWPWAIFKADHDGIRDANGLDAYLFVHFLRMVTRILLPIWLISWVILLPLTSADTSVENHTGLDRFIFGNVARNRQSRYWAHLILTYLFTCE